MKTTQDTQTPPPHGHSRRVAKTRKHVLEAAAQVFAEQGYSGATTRGIAEAAGVSELTLFRHFGSKKNLFMEVIRHGSALPGMQTALAGELSGEPCKDLKVIGAHFLKTLLARRKAILMTLSEAERIPEVRHVSSLLLEQQRQMLAGYMQRQVQSGRLRPQDPMMLAQAFLGMLFAYAINLALSEESLPPDETQLEQIVEFFVDIFLQGAALRDAPSP